MRVITRAAARTMIELPIGNNPQTDTTPNRHHKEIINTSARAEPFLGKGQGIDIVIYIYWDVHPVLDHVTQWNIIPSKEWGLTNKSPPGFDDTSQADSDSH